MAGLYAALVVGAYFVGSIPFGVVIGRAAFGVDPRNVGSGNIGAANSLRALGKTGAILVLIGDVVKGVVPTAIALYAFRTPPLVTVAVGLATIIGHNWSVFLKFSGGKGVATGLGVLVVLSWQAAIAFAVVWLATMGATRYASLSSMLANAAVPLALAALRRQPAFVAYGIVAFVLVMWRHEQNIRRLFAGTELRLGASKDESRP